MTGDTGLTGNNLSNVPGQLASMDLDGIDLLADSILAGGGSRGRGWPRLGIMYYFNPTCNYPPPHVSYLDRMKLAGIIYLHNISLDRKSTRLNSSHQHRSRMPSSA